MDRSYLDLDSYRERIGCEHGLVVCPSLRVVVSAHHVSLTRYCFFRVWKYEGERILSPSHVCVVMTDILLPEAPPHTVGFRRERGMACTKTTHPPLFLMADPARKNVLVLDIFSAEPSPPIRTGKYCGQLCEASSLPGCGSVATNRNDIVAVGCYSFEATVTHAVHLFQKESGGSGGSGRLGGGVAAPTWIPLRVVGVGVLKYPDIVRFSLDGTLVGVVVPEKVSVFQVEDGVFMHDIDTDGTCQGLEAVHDGWVISSPFNGKVQFVDGCTLERQLLQPVHGVYNDDDSKSMAYEQQLSWSLPRALVRVPGLGLLVRQTGSKRWLLRRCLDPVEAAMHAMYAMRVAWIVATVRGGLFRRGILSSHTRSTNRTRKRKKTMS
jgi:hypothetical protein